MEKVLLLTSGKISKTQKILFLSMGILILAQGIINVFNQNYLLSFFAWFQIILGLFYIVAIIFYYSKSDQTTFIKLTDSEFIFKKSPYRKETILSADAITNLEILSSKLIINDINKSYTISFTSLGYIQRKNELPIFLEALKDFKERNSIK